MRAVVAVALLVGVYVLVLVVLVVLAAIVLLFVNGRSIGFIWFAVIGGMLAFDHNRFTEAIEQFRALGSRADGAPWQRFEDPKGTFLEYRVNSCRKAKL